jgi:GT2 family glycosyltransferase/glycosyltransferase involved in cell wall biosynthesis
MLLPVAKYLFRHLPLTASAKVRIATAAFAVGGDLFQALPSYQAWRRARSFSPTPMGLGPVSSADFDKELRGLRFRSDPAPRVSIIIPTYGKLDITLACLRSISLARPRASFEIIVIDDASGDSTMDRLADVPGLLFVKNEQNLGFVGSCNAAAKLARGALLHFLNNDTEVEAGWLDALVELAAARPRSIIGSKLCYPDGRLQEAGGIVWSDGTAQNYGRYEDPDASRFNFVREVDYCSGASLLLSRSFFDELGGFDPHYAPAYYEDTDLCFRARRSGGTVLYQPASIVIHHEGATGGTDLNSGTKRFQVENEAKFRDRWRQVLAHEHQTSGTPADIACDRDRRPVVLVVDHQIIRPDQDAGSRSTLAMIDALERLGFAIKFLPHDLAPNPPYAALLQARGIEVVYGPTYHQTLPQWLESLAPRLKAVLVNRPHVAEDMLPLLRRIAVPIHYYGHDIHFLRMQTEARLRATPRLAASTIRMERLEKTIWSKVDVVYYPSHEEADYVARWAEKAGIDLRVRAIPVFAFDSFPTPPDVVGRTDIMFVGGFAHPPNVDGARWFTNDILPLLRNRFPQLKLWLIGSNPTEAVRALATEGVCVTGNVSEDALNDHYRHRRIAIAPLRFGGGVKGKMVEALRWGVPCVTTAIGAQGLGDAGDALICHNDPAGFAGAITHLLEDDAAWRRSSGTAQAYAKTHFSSEALLTILAKDLGVERPPSHALAVAEQDKASFGNDTDDDHLLLNYDSTELPGSVSRDSSE